MANTLSILMVAAEVHPLAKVGGLADVMGALPAALDEIGHDVRLAIPYYGTIKKKEAPAIRVKGVDVFDVALGDTTMPARVWLTNLPGTKIVVYLIDNADLFDRDGIYTNPVTGKSYPDNADRFIFFSRAVLRMIKLMKWQPDIIHCHDHQTGFIPAWMRAQTQRDDFLEAIGSVFTIHNLAYQGSYPKEAGYRAGFGEDMLKPLGGIEFYGKVNMMKAGVGFADMITTVSPTYAKEIQTPEFGYGLEDVLRARSEDLVGILNGADYGVWNPETDHFIPCTYSSKNLEGKVECKRRLTEQLNLTADPGRPLVGMVSRLVDQKGFDILTEAFDQMIQLGLSIVILGLGDKKYHEMLMTNSERFPGRVSVNVAFDERLAHMIEAGCDMFLMPSKYEPCGLNQMYSMKYGTIPVVRRTGGLADTVDDFDESDESTGFVFSDYTADALVYALARASRVYAEQEEWKALIQRAMAQDFSWERSAGSYQETYFSTVRKRRVVTGS